MQSIPVVHSPVRWAGALTFARSAVNLPVPAATGGLGGGVGTPDGAVVDDVVPTAVSPSTPRRPA